MHPRPPGLVAILVLAYALGLAAQGGPDRDAAWNAFLAWYKAAPLTGDPLNAYAGRLQRDGRSEADVRQELALLARLLEERSDWVEIYFDKVYAKPLQGVLDHQPSTLLVEAVKGLEPGVALDAGMGHGRNAVYLARLGWTVTGFDISEQALETARATGETAGVHLTTVKASYDDFDFGTDRWDLIVLAFAWAPVTDPSFVARLRMGLRPGGRIVFEHFTQADGAPGPNVNRGLKPGQLRACFSRFDILSYEEAGGTGDWAGLSLVRMVALKR